MLRVGQTVDLYYFGHQGAIFQARATIDEWDIAGVSVLITTDAVKEAFFPWNSIQRMVKA